MGKNYSKQRLYRNRDGPEGECIVVNAHFNPIAVSEYEDAPITKPSSELSFQISGSKDGLKGSFFEDKYPLQVVLPPEGSETKSSSNNDFKKPLLENQRTDEKSHLSLEEFECDVSVKAEAGMEKQEFLFTLYDLDGHGKITKDDIAGLVRSIYDAVGSSVKLTPSGSKTIKVRLTVSPDKKDVASDQKFSSSSSPATNNTKNTGINFTDASNTSSPRQSSRKNRPMTIYRQNLIHMIKASVLEKNHCRHGDFEADHQCDEVASKHQHRHRHANNRDHVVECRDRKNHYLDLAGIENYNSKLSDTFPLNQNFLGCPYQLDGTHVCSKFAKSHLNSRTRKAGHHRSRSHDLGTDSVMFRYHLLDKEQSQHLGFVDIFPSEKYKWNNHSRSKSYDTYDSMCSPKLRQHIRKSVANGYSTSPHHHKHRNREREHQRAMQQVANWIEREPLGHKENESDKNYQRFKASPLVVERHEHHHIHEHIHHHYHHYHEV